MTKNEQLAVLYVFQVGDKRTVTERIQVAVTDYCSRCNVSIIQEQEEGKNAFKISKTERGKPFFAQLSQIHVSISHSGEYWVCILSREEIGVDIQEHVKAKGESKEMAILRFLKTAHRFFHSLEAEYVEWNCYDNFFDVWSAKESYVKFTGKGIDENFSEYCVVPEERSVWGNLSESTEFVTWKSMGVWFSKRRYQNAYSMCVCTKNRKEIIVLEMMEN